MKKIHLMSALVLVISLLALFLPGVSRAAEGPSKAKYVMKLAAIAPEGTSWSDTAAKFKAYVEEKTQGQVKVLWYLGAVMGDEPDEIRKIKLGQLQGAGFTVTGLGLIDPAFKILEIPFLLQNNEEVDFVVNKMKPIFTRMLEAKEFFLAGFLDVGFAYIFTKEPITSLDQLSKFKMWTWAGEPVAEAFLKRIGFVNLVPTPLTETLTALQTGMVNSFFVTLYAGVALQWHTQAKYISNFKLGYSPAAILIDKKFFDSLPPDFQKIIMDAWNQYLPELIRLIRIENEKAYKSMLTRGIKVGNTPPEVLEEIQKRILPLRTELVGKYYPDYLLAGIQSALNEFRIRDKGIK
ncbi:MAG: TRAP transporter substrate-binding protein DctP [Proteobacteria bacterium]|nr:TRAP transporter substrate-binding protein DctP [Pseudomonadota bacterium]